MATTPKSRNNQLPAAGGERPASAQPPAPSAISCDCVSPEPAGVGVEGVGVELGAPSTAAGALSSASAVPPNALRLIRDPLGVGSAPTSSAGSPWSVDACGPASMKLCAAASTYVTAAARSPVPAVSPTYAVVFPNRSS